MTIQIEYDDQLEDVIDKVNTELKEKGIQIHFEPDNEEHDGFELYEMVREDLPEGVKEFRMLIEPHDAECPECVIAAGPMCMDRSYCEFDKTGKTWKKYNEEQKNE